MTAGVDLYQKPHIRWSGYASDHLPMHKAAADVASIKHRGCNRQSVDDGNDGQVCQKCQKTRDLREEARLGKG